MNNAKIRHVQIIPGKCTVPLCNMAFKKLRTIKIHFVRGAKCGAYWHVGFHSYLKDATFVYCALCLCSINIWLQIQ